MPFLISKCIDIENNIEDIKTIEETIKNYNSIKDINISFEPEDDDSFKEILKEFNDFGKLIQNNDKGNENKEDKNQEHNRQKNVN